MSAVQSTARLNGRKLDRSEEPNSRQKEHSCLVPSVFFFFSLCACVYRDMYSDACVLISFPLFGVFINCRDLHPEQAAGYLGPAPASLWGGWENPQTRACGLCVFLFGWGPPPVDAAQTKVTLLVTVPPCASVPMLLGGRTPHGLVDGLTAASSEREFPRELGARLAKDLPPWKQALRFTVWAKIQTGMWKSKCKRDTKNSKGCKCEKG